MTFSRHSLLAVTALLLSSCASNKLMEEVKEVDTRTPMVFGASATADAAEVTKATALESAHTDFKVGVWKNFGTVAQQNVMDGYQVDYTSTQKTDYGDGYNWYYEGVNGQLLRYWDLSAFPYEFRAVSPYLTEASIMSDGITVSKENLFRAQMLLNDTYNVTSAESEGCVVAHVSRKLEGTEYQDSDVIKGTEINTANKANATREVHLPFHHLMSKIGFRIFIDNPQPLHDDYEIYVKDITISVVNEEKSFITASSTYSVSGTQNLGIGTFSDNTTATGECNLLEHDVEYPYKEDRGSGPVNVNFHYHLNRESAFDLTPDCLLQIPQSGVKLRVKLDMETRGVEAYNEDFAFDSILRLETLNDTDIPEDVMGDLWTWEPEKKYIYYLHIRNLHGHEIVVHTCEILPWDEVQTSDISVEL